jgi:hypothetical protein
VVVHAVIPVTREAEIGGSWFKANLNKMLRRPCLENNLGMVAHTYNLT